MMALLNICLRAICVAGLIIYFTVLIGCTETVRTIENDSFKVTVSRLNPSAFDAYILSVYVESTESYQFKKSKLLEIQGPHDICGNFIDNDLLLLKESIIEGLSSYRVHYMLRVPMRSLGTIAFDMGSSDDPFECDTIPYAIESNGNRLVYYDSTRIDKVYILRTADTSLFLYTRSILIAPVEKLAGELIHEDTLQLSVTWCGESKTQEILVKLPTSREEDLEYIVRE